MYMYVYMCLHLYTPFPEINTLTLSAHAYSLICNPSQVENKLERKLDG